MSLGRPVPRFPTAHAFGGRGLVRFAATDPRRMAGIRRDGWRAARGGLRTDPAVPWESRRLWEDDDETLTPSTVGALLLGAAPTGWTCRERDRTLRRATRRAIGWRSPPFLAPRTGCGRPTRTPGREGAKGKRVLRAASRDAGRSRASWPPRRKRNGRAPGLGPGQGVQISLPMATAVSPMRFEKPHSLSYQVRMRTMVPSMTLVWSMWNTDERGSWLKSEDTSGSSV